MAFVTAPPTTWTGPVQPNYINLYIVRAVTNVPPKDSNGPPSGGGTHSAGFVS